MVKKSSLNNFKLKYSTLFGIIAALALSMCTEPEEFPNTPEITFNDLVFKNSDSGQDSLILSIDFKDGNGDLGLNSDQNLSEDSFFPYHDLEAIIDGQGQFVTLLSESTSFPWRKTFPNSTFTEIYGEIDDRPDFSCLDYEIGYLNPEKTFFTSDPRIFDEDNRVQIKFHTSLNGTISIDPSTLVEDTIYVKKNENRFNILVDYFVKRNGEYELFDWLTQFDETGCQGIDFNGRFPIFDQTNLNNGSALEGTLKYSMLSSGFNISFRNDTIKLRVVIKDRALNNSNVIETPDFTLQAISED